MFQTAGYPAHPPYFTTYDYDYRTTPPRTPPAAGAHNNYSPRHQAYASTPSQPQYKGHTRRATAAGPDAFGNDTYSTPRKSQYAQEYSSPNYYSSARPTSRRADADYVSSSDRTRDSCHRHAYARRDRAYSSGHEQHYSTRGAQYFYENCCDRDYEYLPRYEAYESRPPPYQRHQTYYVPRADQYDYDQVPIYTSANDVPFSQTQPRPRRSSYNTRSTPNTTPQRPRTSHAQQRPSRARATAEDARRAEIPAGYSYKDWDPVEEPILLLGSVFDANSLGRWIYDWTVHTYGAATPLSEISGDLWLLLIQLAGKIKEAEKAMPKLRQSASRDLVDDFLESGERLWQRFNKLLKVCEVYMLKAAKRESGSAQRVALGSSSGSAFVGAMFGRDRELEHTERLMTGMRLWAMRFDANCVDVLRDPGA